MKALAQVESAHKIRSITAQKIVEEVLDYRGHSIEEIRQKIRKKSLVHTRHLLCYFLNNYTQMSCKEIGVWLSPDDPYDHTTVIHGREKIREQAQRYEDVAMDLMEILNRTKSQAAA